MGETWALARWPSQAPWSPAKASKQQFPPRTRPNEAVQGEMGFCACRRRIR